MKPQPKPDLLSREALILWLMQQPANQEYAFTSPANCLLGHWTRSIDPEAEPDGDWGAHFIYHVNGEQVNLKHFAKIAEGDIAQDWTYGAALRRALESRS